MNRLLIVAIWMLSTAPLYAQGQQQNVAKLKEDARNAVGIIGADRGKTQNYCQIVDLLGRQLERADQEKNKKKTKALSQRRSEEHTSELQSQFHLVCRLLLEKKKKNQKKQQLH